VVFVTVATMYLAGREQNEVVGVLAESSKNNGDFIRFEIRSDISLEPEGFTYRGGVVLDLLMLYCTPVSPLPSASIMNDFMLELNRMSMYLTGEDRFIKPCFSGLFSNPRSAGPGQSHEPSRRGR